MQLFEQYRPKTWADIVGQERAIKAIDRVRERNGTLAGAAYFITGASGTGKTTIARLIAAEIADDWNVNEIDSTGLSAAEIVRLEKTGSVFGLDFGNSGRRGRVFIINEAHGLRKDTIRQLLTTLERIPAHVAWIFTTTKDGERSLFEDCDDANPLLSRCLPITLSNIGLPDGFSRRAMAIAQAEGLDGGKGIASFANIVKASGNNMRAALSIIESGRLVD
jgi:replication-associated recombination protein RarA